VPAGSAVDLHLEGDGTWSAFVGPSCGAAATTSSGTPAATGLVDPVVAPSGVSAPPLTLCRHDGVDETLRGSIEAYDGTGYERTVNLVPLQSYLDGVVPAEESASWGLDGVAPGSPQGEPWGFQALEAQAVAARSYAVASVESGGWNGYADICDTVQCEAYVGANYETAVTDAAVATTSGEVRVPAGTVAPRVSAVVSTGFSASSGGWTAPIAFPAVRDVGDTCVVAGNPEECNPLHAWTVEIPATVVNRKFPMIGRLTRLHVAIRNDHGSFGGRALEVLIGGTKGTVDVSGQTFAIAVGLRSDWFAIVHLRRGALPATPSASASATTNPSTIPGASTTAVP
jgi:stage II sporulation protein D